MTVGVGSVAVIGFGYELGFRTAATTIDKIFGVGTKLTGVTLRNNVERIYNIGQRQAVKMVGLRYEGTWSAESYFSNDDWMLAALGSETDITDPNTGAVIGHKYTVAKRPTSITIEYGFEGSEIVQRDLIGSVIRRVTVDCRVNELATLRFDGMFATESVSNPAALPAGVTDTNEPMTFVDGTLEFPSGTALAKVQNISVDITTGNEVIYAIGSRTAVDAYAKEFEVGGRMTIIAENDDLLRYALGLGDSTTSAPASKSAVTEQSLTLTFDNGSNKAVFTFSGVVIDDVGSRVEANELIMYDVTFEARDLTIEWYL